MRLSYIFCRKVPLIIVARLNVHRSLIDWHWSRHHRCSCCSRSRPCFNPNYCYHHNTNSRHSAQDAAADDESIWDGCTVQFLTVICAVVVVIGVSIVALLVGSRVAISANSVTRKAGLIPDVAISALAYAIANSIARRVLDARAVNLARASGGIEVIGGFTSASVGGVRGWACRVGHSRAVQFAGEAVEAEHEVLIAAALVNGVGCQTRIEV